MKTLQQHISEKLVINKNYKNQQCFTYKVDTDWNKIKIFDRNWKQYNDYKDKVYINGEKVEFDDIPTCSGVTKNTYEPGIYEVFIEDIDNVTDCNTMFWGCSKLVNVPYFDTSKVIKMDYMFYHCKNLTNLPLLNTKKVRNMNDMLKYCNNLNEKSKKEWSKVYDFETNKKKEKINENITSTYKRKIINK